MRAIQLYLGHKNIQHTVHYTELSPQRFKDFWKDWTRMAKDSILAVTIRPPWAHAILHCGKHVETCAWRTTHRGPLR
jgi:hypothetical protein